MSLDGIWKVFVGFLQGSGLVGLWWVFGGGRETHQRPTKDPAYEKIEKIEGYLGASCVRLGCVLGRLGCVLDRLLGVLGRLGGIL